MRMQTHHVAEGDGPGRSALFLFFLDADLGIFVH
jgi:hypothetical protein